MKNSNYFIAKSKEQRAKGKLKGGFTLLELLIYSGMLMILLGVFATLFGMIIDAKLESDSSSGVQQDGQYLLVKLSQDISRASSISIPSSLGSTSATLQLTKDSVEYTYSVDGDGNLKVESASASDILNSFQTSISNTEFRKIGNAGGKPTVQYSFTVTSRTKKNSGYETDTFSSTASLR